MNESAAPARPWALAALAGGAGVAVGAIIATVMLVSGPRPDATLQPTGVAPDEQVMFLLESEGLELGLSNPPGFGSEMVIDLSTLRGFETHQGIELWSAVNAFQSPCLIAIHRDSLDVVARKCVPEGVHLFIDTMSHGLPDGERLRFVMEGNTVAVHHLVPEEEE